MDYEDIPDEFRRMFGGAAPDASHPAVKWLNERPHRDIVMSYIKATRADTRNPLSVRVRWFVEAFECEPSIAKYWLNTKE